MAGRDINNPFGRPHLPPWEQRAEYLKARLDEGLASNMMLSHDWNVVLSRISTPGFPGREENPDGYLWLSRALIPKLRNLSVTEAVIDQMVVGNPRKHFEGVRPGD